MNAESEMEDEKPLLDHENPNRWRIYLQAYFTAKFGFADTGSKFPLELAMPCAQRKIQPYSI